MIKANQYDIIIAGSGCAGLSLLVHLLNSGSFRDQRILIVDQEKKVSNDRTWCFWEKGGGPFEQIVSKTWDQLFFRSFTLSRLFPLDPYKYKLIRSADFYSYCQQVLELSGQVEQLTVKVDHLSEDDAGPYIDVAGERIRAKYIFNSLLFTPPKLKAGEYYLLQHFKGWFIETATGAFDPSQATMMDFRTSQEHGASFVYVMPFTANSALVEYTLFSGSLLNTGQYEAGLKDYIGERLGLSGYRIIEEENGVIPMTSHRFSKGKGNIINIGTAGGQTRGSTGYTFQFIQKHSQQIVRALQLGRHPLVAASAKEKRAAFYDSVLLNILHYQALPAHEIFTRLFARNDPRKVLQFLDKEGSVADDVRLISTLPALPFIKAAMKQV